MVVLATHPSEGLVRDVHGERHGVVTAPPCGHATASDSLRQSTQLICVLNLHTTVVLTYLLTCEKPQLLTQVVHVFLLTYLLTYSLPHLLTYL
jgi:hypothetical protein